MLLILGGMLGGTGASQLGGLISAAGALKKKKKKKKHSVIPSEMVTPVVQGGAGCNRLCREPP